MTKFTGGYGPEYDGNTILLHIDKNNYVIIGPDIYSFRAFDEIIKFASPLANS
ncbi:MAG: hypothetical protein Harvfovirus3_19 [Harvfovirus sp.]|uniref:Uncharacterized protein n=1 Tax=Harvfovirus sp. TaxID=2487768 RepID=A0A3G5A242_9VIRU|nr:MAG: hypothetical protein Harvfovirus3_19 [Harvfovirus sp.]